MSVVSFALAVVFIIRLFSTSAFRVPNLQPYMSKLLAALVYQDVFYQTLLLYASKLEIPRLGIKTYSTDVVF